MEDAVAERAPTLRIAAYCDAVADGVRRGKVPAGVGTAVARLATQAAREGWAWERFAAEAGRRGLIASAQAGGW